MKHLLASFLVLALSCGSGDGTDLQGPGDVPGDTPAETDNGAMPDVVTVTNGHVTLTIDRLTGTFDIALDGHVYFRQVTSAVETGMVSVATLESTIHPAAAPADSPRPMTVTESPGGAQVRLTHPDFGLGVLTTVLTLVPDQGGLIAWLELESSGVEDLVSLIPVYAGHDHSGFFMRSAPGDLQILQNGVDTGVDYYVDLVPGDIPYRRGMMETLLNNLPSAASNWNALVYDRANGEGLNLGFLTFDRVVPEVVIGYQPEDVPSQDGVDGYPLFQSRCPYLIARNEPKGSLVISESFWLDRFAGRPQASLERYARLLAERYPPPPARQPRAGWDSWYVFSHVIDEDLIRKNLHDLVDHFGAYGLNSLEVDLGWEMEWGSWREFPPGFPSGMTALADEIRQAGLEPEIWMSSFNAMDGSTVLEAHPDWVASYEPIMHVLAQPGAVPLDLSRPDVIDFVRSTGEEAAAWGYGSTKFDFAYYWMFANALHDPATTLVESFRRGMEAYGEGFGKDGFLINILLMGANYGLVDSMRVGIDTWACWGDDPQEKCPEASQTTGYSAMGIRPAVKTLARRYYYNNVVWVNHPDQVFFRDHLGLVPQRTWGTLVALSGAVISLGEEAASMTPDEIDTFRRFIPNLGITGVPQDLFEREYPEVWVTSLEGLEPGGAVLGLYNWGTNRDLTHHPAKDLPETVRHHEVALADLGLEGTFRAFEFWTGTDLGVLHDGVVTMDVPARDCRVIGLRPVRDRPYLLASNRHVSQGGTDLHGPAWDAAKKTLTWDQDLVQGFPHVVHIDPAGWQEVPAATATQNAQVKVAASGDLLEVTITPSVTDSSHLTLDFGL